MSVSCQSCGWPLATWWKDLQERLCVECWIKSSEDIRKAHDILAELCAIRDRYQRVLEAGRAWLESMEDIERPETGDHSFLCELRDELKTGGQNG